MALCSLLGICESSMQNNVVPSQVSQVNDGASTSSTREFAGFPETLTQHVVVGHSPGAAFDVDDANGPPVTGYQDLLAYGPQGHDSQTHKCQGRKDQEAGFKTFTNE